MEHRIWKENEAKLLAEIKELKERAEHWENEAHTLGHVEYAQRTALRQLAEIILAEHKGCGETGCPQKEAALAAMKYLK